MDVMKKCDEFYFRLLSLICLYDNNLKHALDKEGKKKGSMKKGKLACRVNVDEFMTSDG